MKQSHRSKLTAAVSIFIVCVRSPPCIAFSATRGAFATGPRVTPRRSPVSSMVVDPSMMPSMLASSLHDGGGHEGDGASLLAQGLGYLVGAGSFLLYTPIAVRIVRQKTAEGLTLSTWWLKLASYTCSDVYAFTRGYPLSTYVETLVITAEALVLLLLVSYFQKSMDLKFAAAAVAFGLCAVLLLQAPPEVIALGQGGSAVLNAGALVPQFMLNAQLQKAGGYSPITAALASAGCAIRLFTTIQLTGADPILLGTFGLALLLNAGLLAQILYYGVAIEGKSVLAVLTADARPAAAGDGGYLPLNSRDPPE